MTYDFLTPMGEALRARRRSRGLSQPDLARRLGRGRARVSELEVDLIAGRVGRDRLGLLVETCDALDLVPVLVPRERVQAVRRLLTGAALQPAASTPGRAFDDLYVDLAGEAEEGA